ncbi:serine hydrolase [Alterisphingorhabdus coralli]|uniref:Serine hydrolase n=1 Tax=Alterisphingorhabdus coralli TaxID=3071408 RepID=A0AA97HZH7_9SPHN|nr:serine hydrolase [Parasphingorhabdus sp. SCSIO 66989]WOE73862.1 serine hydrolase [Parasphingorhabdus sp. SCSIO 66989]
MIPSTPDRVTHLWRIGLVLMATFALSFTSPALAQQRGQDAASVNALTQRANDVLRLLRGEPIEEQVFNANFLNAIPPVQFRAFTKQMTDQYGPPQQILSITTLNRTTATLKIAYSETTATGILNIEDNYPYRISGLRITGFEAAAGSINEVIAAIDALPGKQGLIIQRLDQRNAAPLAAIDPDGLYSIASTAKLYILAELDRAIRAGERRWSDVVTLGPKSHPSGVMQDWPENSPVTLHTLATQMIAISDNTATDTLVRVIGQERLAAMVQRTGHRNPYVLRPFLMTREVSALKTPANAALLAKYLAGDPARRERLLKLNKDALALERIDFAALTARPYSIDSIGWFASAADIARLLDYLRREASDETKTILALNPGIGKENAANWRYLGYKGGSQTGIMSMNFLLTSRSGEHYAVAAHWNDKNTPVNEGEFIALMTRLINLLAER